MAVEFKYQQAFSSIVEYTFNGSHGTGSPSCSPVHAPCQKVPAEPRPVHRVPPDQGSGVLETSQSSWWKDSPNIVKGSTLGPMVYRQLVFIDTSSVGWALSMKVEWPLGGSAYKCPGAESCSSRTLMVSAEIEIQQHTSINRGV